MQGVGFRWFAREQARALRVNGWVANRDDGAVELLAEGDASALSQLAAAVRRGPTGASVERVNELPDDGQVVPAGFAVKR